MENEQISIIDYIIQTHSGLKRQGPGSPEMTIKALSFLDNIGSVSRVLDLGCGTGGQTIVLAQNTSGSVTGVDIIPDFISIFNDNARKLNLSKRVEGITGSMLNLSFLKNEYDLIWSEGAIDNIGFEKGLNYWNGFLKKNGYIAVSCPSWLTDEHPAEIEKFWIDAGSGLDSIANNILIMQKAGYSFVASFKISDKCWTDNYFIPREAAGKAFVERYKGNESAEGYFENDRYEGELFTKYKEYYGYVFYIGKKR
jgi:SAM-dependent methyltransferase